MLGARSTQFLFVLCLFAVCGTTVESLIGACVLARLRACVLACLFGFVGRLVWLFFHCVAFARVFRCFSFRGRGGAGLAGLGCTARNDAAVQTPSHVSCISKSIRLQDSRRFKVCSQACRRGSTVSTVVLRLHPVALWVKNAAQILCLLLLSLLLDDDPLRACMHTYIHTHCHSTHV